MATLGKIALGVAAFVAGFLVGFFTAGPTLFADGPLGSRLLSLGLVLAGFGLLGMLLGGVSPKNRWLPFVAAAGVLPVALGIPFADAAPAVIWAVAAGCAAAAVLGAWLGAMVGRAVRGRRAA